MAGLFGSQDPDPVTGVQRQIAEKKIGQGGGKADAAILRPDIRQGQGAQLPGHKTLQPKGGGSKTGEKIGHGNPSTTTDKIIISQNRRMEYGDGQKNREGNRNLILAEM
jgi:hypothetical protein